MHGHVPIKCKCLVHGVFCTVFTVTSHLQSVYLITHSFCKTHCSNLVLSPLKIDARSTLGLLFLLECTSNEIYKSCVGGTIVATQ